MEWKWYLIFSTANTLKRNWPRRKFKFVKLRYVNHEMFIIDNIQIV